MSKAGAAAVVMRGRPLWSLRLAPILLLGAALRLVGLNNVSPPGLEHDEIANWLIDRSILAGNHAIYFTEAYGHEAAFHYVQAAFVALVGDHALALRLPAAFLGLLAVSVTFTLARQMFGARTAYVSAALIAVLFFPVFYSRLGLRAIMLPVLSGMSALFWWKGWRLAPTSKARSSDGGWLRRLLLGARHTRVLAPGNGYETRNLLLAGLFAGLSVHTYMAARTVPIFYALFLLAILVLNPAMVRARWRQIALFWLIFAAVASPLVIYLLTNPGAEFRISEVDAPLRALQAGKIGPVVDNFVDILGSFGVQGDPLWRQNVAHMAIFDPLLAALFYACVGLSLLYVRDVRYLFLILWALTATIPSIVTIDAPSSIRMINILPVLTILPAILMHNIGRLSTEKDQLSTTPVDNWLLWLVVFGLVAINTARTVQAVFVTWPANDEVRFVWQEALTDAATYLDSRAHIEEVAVGGWTPDTMDAPTMAVTLRRQDLALRHFDPRHALLLPSSHSDTPTLVVHPTILPLDAALSAPLRAAGVVSETQGSFVTYPLSRMPDLRPAIARSVTFADELTFFGYTPGAGCSDVTTACDIVGYWRVELAPFGERRIFVHIVDEEGAVIGTADALGAPSEFWQPGDVILQKHTLPAGLMNEGSAVHIGIYEPASNQRLLTAGGRDFERVQPYLER